VFTRRPEGPLGLLAGRGELPLLFAQAVFSQKKPLVVVGVRGQTDPRIEPFATRTHYIDLGAFGDLPRFLRGANVKRVVLAGGLPKKEVYNPALVLDQASRGILDSTRNRGDDHLLRAFGVFLKVRCGVSVIDGRTILKDAIAPKGVLTRRKPTEAEWKDLRFGRTVARQVGRMDIGQTVVVKQGIVLAVEAIEGTDSAIRRGGELGAGGVVVVKTAKPNQDLRFDLPCVGTETLQSLKAVSCRALGVEAGKTLILSRRELVEAADRDGITIVGL